MRRLYLIIIYMCLTLVVGRVHAQYYSVNYDKQIVAAMAAAFGAGAMAESYYNEQVGEILKHYNAAEVATAGIFAAKFLERKAFTDLGIWSSSTENYYYRRIHNMVANKIMPKIWTVAGMMLKSPQTALYWGSYLMKICADTKSLCMQFESVVTNSSLTFADIQFLEINQEIAAILKLSEIGNVDWQQLLDDIASVPGNFTVENLTADIETLYNMGASLATAGINGASGALLQQSAFNDLFNGKVSKIIDIYDNYHDLYEQAENGIGSTLLSLVGGEDNVAALFDLSNYNITSWMTDYLSETQGNYYTQRWYIARRDQGSVSLCDYYPPTDDNSILNGDHWYRINTSDPNFYPNSTQREQILANSENHAGWSRSRVQQLNAQSDGFTYTMNYWMSSYIISRGGKQTKKAYAYEIHVTKSWNNVEEVYEDVFDSYSMDLNTFKRQLQARLSEYNDNEEGYVYYIGSDARRYYQATDAAKLKGVESVTISVTCSDGVTLGQGSTQYKCRECGGSLNAHSKECAMRTSVSENNLDLSELDEKEREANSKIALLEAQISQLETELKKTIYNHSRLIGETTELSQLSDQIINRAKLRKLRPVFDFKQALNTIMKLDQPDLLAHVLEPLFAPRMDRYFTMRNIDNILTLRSDEKQETEKIEKRELTPDFKYEDEILEEKIGRNFAHLFYELCDQLKKWNRVTLKEYNGILEIKFGEEIYTNRDYYAFLVHLSGKRSYRVDEMLEKQETMLEEMVVEHLTEEEKERIRDIRFTITFGTDEVEIKPQMQDIEAVEPFVVTDMNFEREAAE